MRIEPRWQNAKALTPEHCASLLRYSQVHFTTESGLRECHDQLGPQAGLAWPVLRLLIPWRGSEAPPDLPLLYSEKSPQCFPLKWAEAVPRQGHR